MDVYTTEFAAYSREYYEESIQLGRIRVNGEKVTPDYKIQNGDLICHTVHRHILFILKSPLRVALMSAHEPPVTDEKVYLIEETEDMYCVYKPSSIPVHPCGAYRHNTLEFILRTELGLSRSFFIHRLDRVTSGIRKGRRKTEKEFHGTAACTKACKTCCNSTCHARNEIRAKDRAFHKAHHTN